MLFRFERPAQALPLGVGPRYQLADLFAAKDFIDERGARFIQRAGRGHRCTCRRFVGLHPRAIMARSHARTSASFHHRCGVPK